MCKASGTKKEGLTKITIILNFGFSQEISTTRERKTYSQKEKQKLLPVCSKPRAGDFGRHVFSWE